MSASFVSKPILAWVKNFQTNVPDRIALLPKALFGAPLRPDIMQRVSVWYRAGLRAGTACTKERGEVSGSGRKLRPQKGLGKARVGSSRTPNRVGGGVAFGPKPRDFGFHLPRKILALGFRSALSAKYRHNQLLLVEHASLALPSSKTKHLAWIIASHYPDTKIAVIDTEEPTANLLLASRAISNFRLYTTSDNLNAHHVLDSSLLIMTTRAVEHYQKLYDRQ